MAKQYQWLSNSSRDRSHVSSSDVGMNAWRHEAATKIQSLVRMHQEHNRYIRHYLFPQKFT